MGEMTTLLHKNSRQPLSFTVDVKWNLSENGFTSIFIFLKASVANGEAELSSWNMFRLCRSAITRGNGNVSEGTTSPDRNDEDINNVIDTLKS